MVPGPDSKNSCISDYTAVRGFSVAALVSSDLIIKQPFVSARIDFKKMCGNLFSRNTNNGHIYCIYIIKNHLLFKRRTYLTITRNAFFSPCI